VNSVLENKYYPLGAPWLYNDNEPDNNPNINGLITWAFALVTFQNIVPISLYISIEAVRTLQAAFIYFDREIWYDKTDTPTLARSWNLSDDLGQIQYIFSDKTGTLTQVSARAAPCVYALTPSAEPHGLPWLLRRRAGIPRRPGAGRGR
jgi:phospholipid-translocating ATPase